jgi:hypothetical protein
MLTTREASKELEKSFKNKKEARKKLLSHS